MSRLREDFYIVAGFPRAASTFLWYVLKQHPDISVSSKKEPMYFNRDHFYLGYPLRRRGQRTFEKYCSLFENKKIKIDFSVMTCYDQGSIERIKEEVGDVGIIFLKRRDGHRGSMINLMGNLGETCSKEKLDYYMDTERHIEYYKKHFSRVRVFDITEDSEGEIKKILDFVGAKEMEFDYNVERNSIEERYREGKNQTFRRWIFIYFPRTHTMLRNMIKSRKGVRVK